MQMSLASETAGRWGFSQAYTIDYRGLHATPLALVERLLREVETTMRSSRFAKYWTVFFAISDKHFNILHEVSLPQFRDRGVAQVLSVG